MFCIWSAGANTEATTAAREDSVITPVSRFVSQSTGASDNKHIGNDATVAAQSCTTSVLILLLIRIID